MKSSLFVFAAILICLSGCEITPTVSSRTTEPTTATLTWHNYNGTTDDPETAMYLLNGKEVGRGRAGFRQVLSKLGELPPKSEVIIDYDARSLSRNQGFGYLLPFSDFIPELLDLAEKRQLRLLKPGGGLFGGVLEQRRDIGWESKTASVAKANGTGGTGAISGAATSIIAPPVFFSNCSHTQFTSAILRASCIS